MLGIKPLQPLRKTLAHFIFNPPPVLLFSFPQKPKSKAQKNPTTFVFVIIINLYSLKSLTMKKPIQAQIQNPPHCERNRPLKSTPIPLPLSPNPNQRKLLSSSLISNPSFDNVSYWDQSQVQQHPAIGGELSPEIDDEADQRTLSESPHEGGALAGGRPGDHHGHSVELDVCGGGGCGFDCQLRRVAEAPAEDVGCWVCDPVHDAGGLCVR